MAFSLDLKAPINGIYLNSETIELLTIVQCSDIKQLKQFALNCIQLNIDPKNIESWKEEDLETKKRELVDLYKESLLPMEKAIKDRDSVVRHAIISCGIPEEEADIYLDAYHNGGYEGVKQTLFERHPEEYGELSKKAHNFIATERDQLKSVTYDELLEINNILQNHDTILIASGRYYDVTNKMHMPQSPNSEKYDFYYAQRGLDFCERNQKHARYHTLLDKQTMEEHFMLAKLKLKDPKKIKEYIIKELKEYVEKSITFIKKYNDDHKLKDGKGVISSVDLFNEIISFDPPYRNMWNELYGISTEDLAEIFKFALDNKPEGVTYVYNEPFLENPDRRTVVINQLKEINKYAPGLIDTIGTQMHILMNQDVEEVRDCFRELKELKEIGIGTQITEFDMCIPEKYIFDENGKISHKYSPEEIEKYKMDSISKISEAVSSTGIELDGITYWSLTDKLDHNLERTNKNTYILGLDREIATTRYGGLYGDLERQKAFSMTRLIKSLLANREGIKLVEEADKTEDSQGKEDENKSLDDE